MKMPKSRAPTSPGEVLREEFLVPLELSQAELARRIRVSQGGISEIIAGKRAVTAETAMRLGKLFGTSAELWLNLQQKLDLWRASNEIGTELDAIEPIRRTG